MGLSFFSSVGMRRKDDVMALLVRNGNCGREGNDEVWRHCVSCGVGLTTSAGFSGSLHWSLRPESRGRWIEPLSWYLTHLYGFTALFALFVPLTVSHSLLGVLSKPSQLRNPFANSNSFYSPCLFCSMIFEIKEHNKGWVSRSLLIENNDCASRISHRALHNASLILENIEVLATAIAWFWQ